MYLTMEFRTLSFFLFLSPLLGNKKRALNSENLHIACLLSAAMKLHTYNGMIRGGQARFFFSIYCPWLLYESKPP